MIMLIAIIAWAILGSAFVATFPQHQQNHETFQSRLNYFVKHHPLYVTIAPDSFLISKRDISNAPDPQPNANISLLQRGDEPTDKPGGNELEINIELTPKTQQEFVAWVDSELSGGMDTVEEYLFARNWAPIVTKILEPRIHLTPLQLKGWVFDLMHSKLDFPDVLHAVGAGKLAMQVISNGDITIDGIMRALEVHLSVTEEDVANYVREHSYYIPKEERATSEEQRYRLAYFGKIVAWNMFNGNLKLMLKDMLENGGLDKILGGNTS